MENTTKKPKPGTEKLIDEFSRLDALLRNAKRFREKKALYFTVNLVFAAMLTVMMKCILTNHCLTFKPPFLGELLALAGNLGMMIWYDGTVMEALKMSRLSMIQKLLEGNHPQFFALVEKGELDDIDLSASPDALETRKRNHVLKMILYSLLGTASIIVALVSVKLMG